MFDIQMGIEIEDSADAVAEMFLEGGTANLPEAIRPKCDIPPHCRMQLILASAGPSKLDVLKHSLFKTARRPMLPSSLLWEMYTRAYFERVLAAGH